MPLTVVAPTDAQLGYIASLCREHGLQPPERRSPWEADDGREASEGEAWH